MLEGRLEQGRRRREGWGRERTDDALADAAHDTARHENVLGHCCKEVGARRPARAEAEVLQHVPIFSELLFSLSTPQTSQNNTDASRVTLSRPSRSCPVTSSLPPSPSHASCPRLGLFSHLSDERSFLWQIYFLAKEPPLAFIYQTAWPQHLARAVNTRNVPRYIESVRTADLHGSSDILRLPRHLCRSQQHPRCGFFSLSLLLSLVSTPSSPP